MVRPYAYVQTQVQQYMNIEQEHIRYILKAHHLYRATNRKLQLQRRCAGRSGLVVARLPAAREGPGSNRAADKSLCFHENHCDTQL